MVEANRSLSNGISSVNAPKDPYSGNTASDSATSNQRRSCCLWESTRSRKRFGFTNSSTPTDTPSRPRNAVSAGGHSTPPGLDILTKANQASSAETARRHRPPHRPLRPITGHPHANSKKDSFTRDLSLDRSTGSDTLVGRTRSARSPPTS